ncbi:carbohydrate ABC transporter permease [Chelatococcus asaccharovorans]|uniref:carbohydrate ABC transporter permease n=1 Tax=Chelatococcus asaccharovorans TaxID=28210 RepID=UPI00224C755A|nr:carbohydrate ABC transporter permease [Chelatococcus asaccharovorans]CAH1652173.1 Carbohydrate ABC transporter membrane protein 2 (CUT1 family) [Chelatococcus asaccharovorans]CAH1693366.1 Carbohydrate ABC transporter membrane protein 2 (CUT1 family) [Chelatococcus asaccharovorans]
MISRRTDILRTCGLMTAAALFFLFMFTPVYWMVATSLMTEAEMLAVPPHFIPEAPTLRNYATIFGIGDPEYIAFAQNRAPAVFDIFPAMINSLTVGLCVALANLLIASPAAYAFSRLNVRRSLPLLMVYLGSRMLPPIMLVVPMFLLMRNFGLIDTPLSLIAAYCILTVPFSIWLLQAYFKTMPVELEDSAVIDGATRWQTMRYVVLPLARPGLTCVAILAFMASWSEFLFAVVFTKTTASKTLPVVTASFVDTASIQFDYVMTAGVLTALPPFLLALIFQRYILGGLAAGAVKG